MLVYAPAGAGTAIAARAAAPAGATIYRVSRSWPEDRR